VDALGAGVDGLAVGERVGVPWLGETCGDCPYCREDRENLCDRARFTGYDIDGGFAELAVADARYCFPVPEGFPDLQAASLLCAGLIGYRSWRMAGQPRRVGFYGFGSAAHTLILVARFQGSEVYAFTRPGDEGAQEFARGLGARWAGSSEGPPPVELDAAILFAPVGVLITAALRAVGKGAPVVCAGIHMSDIPSFPYRILWEERASARWQTSPAALAPSSWRWRRRRRSARGARGSIWDGPTGPWPHSGKAGSRDRGLGR